MNHNVPLIQRNLPLPLVHEAAAPPPPARLDKPILSSQATQPPPSQPSNQRAASPQPPAPAFTMQYPFSDDDDPFISSQLVSSQAPRSHRVKVINDPIHGHLEVSGTVLDCIDTPHVQRLRDLKQLGVNYLVFPGASHNRFEHCVGVSHLSNAFVTGLYNNPRDPNATACYENHSHFKHSVQLVELAGLCHDLGHGPFSHLFDYHFLPEVRRGVLADDHPLRHHEARSVMMFENLVDEYQIDIDRLDVRHIGELIAGLKVRHGGAGAHALTPAFLYDVVANGKNGIDTDKFDYLARDVYNLGLQGAYGFDHRRLMKFAKVIDDSVCFHRKEVFNVYHLFLTRFQLHRTVYNHRAALSIGAMITDAFLEADSTLKISDSISDPTDFMTMTDSLVPIIERSKDSSLASARKIIHRLRRRQLYRFVDEVLLPAGASRRISPEEITTCQDASTGVNLVPRDIYIAHVTLNFGMKSKNPVDNVLFFKDWEDQSPTHISTAKASYVIPAHFEEKIIRVFLKREKTEDDSRVKKAVRVAFRNFMRRSNLCSPTHSPTLTKRTRTHDISAILESDEDGLGGSTDTQLTPPGADAAGTTMNQRLAKRSRPLVGREG